MALAFTKEQEKEIVSRLKKAAREGIAKAGMRKTTVDTLVQAAGISKGAFYKFYTSKELLFFELLEDLHTEVYTIAAGVLVENAALPPVERTAKAVLAACRIMGESKLLAFAALEATDLLRSIPHEVLEEHYHSDEVHIRALLEEAGLNPEGRRHGTRADAHPLPPAGDRFPVSPGTGDLGVWVLRQVVPLPLKKPARWRLF